MKLYYLYLQLRRGNEKTENKGEKPMKRTIAAVALVLAILAVGYWGMAGWWQEKRELSALQSEYESARELQQALLEEKTALEGELNELQEQNGDANETLQSWKVWKESLEATLAG